MKTVKDLRGSTTVSAAEEVLSGWHHLVIEHGVLPGASRTVIRRRLSNVCFEVSKSRPVEISLLQESIEITVGPPDGQSGIEWLLDALIGDIAEGWELSYWVD